MRRILIVSPHFPPTNTPDMQRVRMLLPFLEECGWKATILSVEPQQVAAPQDEWLVEGLPAGTEVHRAKALGLGWARLPGLGALGLRALRALAKVGDRLLTKGNYDLVYFSTTAFEVHLLGPRWKRRFGVPFTMDYQDPWVSDYYREHAEIAPPGGRLKYALAEALHRWLEPRVLRACAGITSVSPAYPQQLACRYPWIHGIPRLVQPFPGAQRDFARLVRSGVSQQIFNPDDGCRHWVYVGAVIPGMFPALRALFRAMVTSLPASERERIRLHFVGTSYAPAGQAVPVVRPLAEEHGLADLVEEQTARIPYAQALKCLMDADALLAIGSDDPSYTASKIYPYLLARKPLLAIYHEQSSVVDLVRKVGGAVCIPFTLPVDENLLAQTISRSWLENGGYTRQNMLNVVAFSPYTDRASAGALCGFWEECVAHA